MAVYNYMAPRAPKYNKPTSVEDCIEQARLFVTKQHSRAALGPVNKGDKVLIVTLPDQDSYVQQALVQAFKEEGAEKVDFVNSNELNETEAEIRSVEDGWLEASDMINAPTGSDEMPFVEELCRGIRSYLNKNPDYTTVFAGLGGRKHTTFGLYEHGSKFRNNWVFNNWEEFVGKTWSFPDDLWIEIERPIIEAIGMAAEVRITDPEGTHLEYSLTEEEARRFQMCAWKSGHLFLDAFQATSNECAMSPVSTDVPPVFHRISGVLAGTSNHVGYMPRMELYFEEGVLVKVIGGGKYGSLIEEMMEKYKNVHFPQYPRKGFFWFCDSALCTAVKSFRRTSDMFNSYWSHPNLPERNRAGIFHHGFGSRRHGQAFFDYIRANKVPHSHLHVHNYFNTMEIKIRGSQEWLKLADKGHLTSLDDPKVRSFAVKYGDPNEILSYDWVPPVPGINCEGDYWKDYAPDPAAYLKKRLKEGKPI